MMPIGGRQMAYRPQEPHRCDICREQGHCLLECPYLPQSLAIIRKLKAEHERHLRRCETLNEERRLMLTKPPKRTRKATTR